MTIRAALGHTPNVSEPLPGLVTAGQPTRDDLAAARAAGATTIIDLRDPMEARPFDEPAEVAALGMTYLNVPVVSGALNDDALDRILAALRAAAGAPVILHCASANRVGGALIPHLMLDHGLSEQDAVDTAMRVGMRSAELMEWGVDYARRHGA